MITKGMATNPSLVQSRKLRARLAFRRAAVFGADSDVTSESAADAGDGLAMAFKAAKTGRLVD
jgi:hypothetical protein